jgi:hypothetical protein
VSTESPSKHKPANCNATNCATMDWQVSEQQTIQPT